MFTPDLKFDQKSRVCNLTMKHCDKKLNMFKKIKDNIFSIISFRRKRQSISSSDDGLTQTQLKLCFNDFCCISTGPSFNTQGDLHSILKGTPFKLSFLIYLNTFYLEMLVYICLWKFVSLYMCSGSSKTNYKGKVHLANSSSTQRKEHVRDQNCAYD